MTVSPIKIAISIGDPAGIGPEVTWKALADEEIRNLAQWIVVGESWLADELNADVAALDYELVSLDDDFSSSAAVLVLDRGQLQSGQREFGKVSAACGAAGLDYVKTAAELCLAGKADAMVTGPLNKEAVALNGTHFSGHTEFIAELCGRDDSRMLLYNEQLCVVHVSTHCSLAEATRVTKERILKTIELGHDAVVRLGWENPRVAVCGLNPHAGENGMFGREEIEHIQPAIDQANTSGIRCVGPFPADTLMMQAVRGNYDLVVAMYHDQGHVAMKVYDFEHTVNVTLGLPIIRTSVDHGTAFDIAGKNLADPEDMKTAMRLAIKMAAQKSVMPTLDVP